MVLDELHELIETLRSRIDLHAAELQKSEALTRYSLVDPLLRSLNWDTADPSQVVPEYSVSSSVKSVKFADYALLGSNGQPRIIVEVKSLQSPLQDAALQALGYCNENGFRYFAVTDGRFWRLYETFRAVPLDEKLVISLDLKAPVAETCLNALALWRRAVETGSMKLGATPIVESSETPPTTTQPVKPAVQPSEDGWQPLSECTPEPGAKPSAVRMPSGAEIAAMWWGPFNEAIVRWLSAEGHLTAAHLPIRNSNGKFVLTSKSDPAKGPSGQPLGNLRAFEQYSLNPNFNGADNVSHARLIIKSAGQNPADFAVKMQ